MRSRRREYPFHLGNALPTKSRLRYDVVVNRSGFLTGLGAAALVGAAPFADVDLPVELRGGRFFAVPRTVDGKTFACWLDTDGAGFIFDSAVEAFHLTTRDVAGKRRAALPRLATASFPPLSTASDLPVFERSAQDRVDPILAGFDAQLGRTWFEGRTWRFDWPRGRCTLLADSLSSGDGNVPLRLEDGYTRIPVTVDGETLIMSFDIAASVAMKPDRAVHATTFVRHAQVERWHTSHPDWTLERNIGVEPGIDRIVVPAMEAGTVTLHDVSCTTRPSDDVFEGEYIDGKLGANAYAGCVVTLDYRTSRLHLC